MSLHVFGQVVASHKPTVTVRTAVPLISSVSARVPRQFVRTCKALPAVCPRANKGSLARVGPDVSLQMGRLVVELVTIPVLTPEHFLIGSHDPVWFVEVTVTGINGGQVTVTSDQGGVTTDQGGVTTDQGGVTTDQRVVV